MYNNIKPLNEQEYKVFQYLTEAARTGERQAVKINNDSTYMPVCVEILLSTPAYEHVSICHYGEMNGDLMADPEVVFYHDRSEGKAYPGYFKNDYAGVEMDAIYYNEEEKPQKVNVNLQTELAEFCEMWMRNINEQQELNLITCEEINV